MRIEGIRAINGPNVYHAKPVSVMTLRLGELTGKETTGFPGFTDRLLELLPGLFKHHCAKGAEGGFVERLNEGTYFGHVVEHVALELAGQLGGKGNYGKTRYAGEPGLYHVIVRHDNEAAMRCLLETSVSLVDTLIRGEDFSVTAPLERAASIMEETGPGPSTQAVITAAELRGIPWRRLTDGSLVELGQGRNLKRIQAAVTADTGQIAVDAACDKALARQLLADAFLPVPHGEVVTRFEDALPLLDRIGLPLVVKPVYGNQGRAVTMDVADAAGLEEAFLLAAQVSEEVLVEQQVAGLDYRVLVVDGNVVAASRRVPCHVVGDGSSSIAELIRSANLDARRGNGHSKPLTRIEGTDFKDLDLSRVPEADEKIVLRRAANLSQGGTAIDVTDEVHPEIRAACVRAARVIGLDVCGVDLLTSDISRPLDGAIIEVNASPGLRMHLYPDEGDARPVGEAIVSMLYPSGAPARIPVCSVTGTNGKTTVTRLIAFVLARAGLRVGASTTDGIMIGGELVARGDMTGPASARVVLSDTSVDAAVLECARGGIIRRGLGFDWADTGVITNIRLDHVGQDGIEDLDDLTWIKSLVAERVRSGGTVVLNADDDAAAGLAEQSRRDVLTRVEEDEIAAASAGGMDCPRRRSSTGPRLALDEHRQVGGDQPCDPLCEAAHCLRGAYQAGDVRRVARYLGAQQMRCLECRGGLHHRHLERQTVERRASDIAVRARRIADADHVRRVDDGSAFHKAPCAWCDAADASENPARALGDVIERHATGNAEATASVPAEVEAEMLDAGGEHGVDLAARLRVGECAEAVCPRLAQHLHLAPGNELRELRQCGRIRGTRPKQRDVVRLHLRLRFKGGEAVCHQDVIAQEVVGFPSLPARDQQFRRIRAGHPTAGLPLLHRPQLDGAQPVAP